MHTCLPDTHSVATNFFLQAFLSEQSFPSLSISCCSSVVYFVLFQGYLAASLNFINAVDIDIDIELHSGFFLPVGLIHDTDYFPLQQSFNWYLVKRAVQFQISYHSH